MDVRDVASGHLLAAELGRSGERYVLGGVNVSYQKLIGALGGRGGDAAARLVPLPPWAAARGGLGFGVAGRLDGPRAGRHAAGGGAEPAELVRLLGQARRELGYQARPLAETFATRTSGTARRSTCARTR